MFMHFPSGLGSKIDDSLYRLAHKMDGKGPFSKQQILDQIRDSGVLDEMSGPLKQFRILRRLNRGIYYSPGFLDFDRVFGLLKNEKNNAAIYSWGFYMDFWPE